MDNGKTYCSCGAEHDFDGNTVKKFKWPEKPEYIECSECPECNPELLENIEDHEDEAYKQNGEANILPEDINIEEDFEDEEY